MSVKYIILLVLIGYALCEECTLHYKPNVPESKKQLLSRISLLTTQRFLLKAGEFTYAVTICSDVSKDHPSAAATKSYNADGKNTTVIGRLNDTHIVGGNDWILLTYASGDVRNYSTQCQNTSMKTSVMVLCNRESDETVFELAEEDVTGDCEIMFTLKTAVVCPNTLQGLSKGSIFCVLVLTGGMMYLVIGVAYRRIMTGAQGVEQIPHYQFWRDLGNLQADGCNFVCRKGQSREEPWNRITSNFNDPADEPLLHP